MTRRVILHIDRLVLRGVDRTDAAALSAAIQAELRHRLAEPGSAQAIAATGSRGRVAAGEVRIGDRQTAGQAIADQVASHLVGRGKP